MTHTLPDIEPLEKQKVGRTYKYIPTDRQKAYMKEWVSKVTVKELADKFGVCERTMSTVLKSQKLNSSNKKIERERRERQSVEQTVTNKVKRIVEAENNPDDPTIFIAGMSTGKDLNGVPLNNEHRLAIDLLKSSSETPQANVEYFARLQDSKLRLKRLERQEQRIKEKAPERFTRRKRYYYDELKRDLKDMGMHFPVLKRLMMNAAAASARNDEAQDELNRVGMYEEVITAKGHYGGTRKTAAYEIAQETSRAEQVAYRQLNTEIDKILRRRGESDEGNDENDKVAEQIAKYLAEDNLPNQINK